MDTLNDALAIMEMHAEADRFVQGCWISELDGVDEEGFFRGCFFGCAMQSNGLKDDPIEAFCVKYGMPIWLGYLSERLFEKMSPHEAAGFPVELLTAMVKLPKDFDYSKLYMKLILSCLQELKPSGRVEEVVHALEEHLGEDFNTDRIHPRTKSAIVSYTGGGFLSFVVENLFLGPEEEEDSFPFIDLDSYVFQYCDLGNKLYWDKVKKNLLGLLA